MEAARVRAAIFKEPVDGTITVRKLNPDGNQQAQVGRMLKMRGAFEDSPPRLETLHSASYSFTAVPTS